MKLAKEKYCSFAKKLVIHDDALEGGIRYEA
jgi:ribosomal protein L33